MERVNQDDKCRLLQLSLFCNFPGLSTSFFGYLTYSSGDLTHSGTSTYLQLQCSGSIAMSIEYQVGLLSHFQLGFVSDGSGLLPSTFPFVEEWQCFVSLSYGYYVHSTGQVFEAGSAERVDVPTRGEGGFNFE